MGRTATRGQGGGGGGGGKIHDALYRAYFVGGVNLANVDELVRIAESLDLSGDEAREVLQTRAERQAVDLDWERSRQLGVTGVPTFMADNETVVGAQPYEMLEALVTRAGARKRAG
ncbi:MAG: DsbA family protein [Gemmatimonadetes bacterium]|nr:DsbA family protein [Gemmatimonadota bacterium]